MQPQTQIIRCGEVTLHVRVWNAGATPCVVIWHGVTGTNLDHAPLAQRLAAAGFAVIAPDSPGCGLSDWAADSRTGYSLTAFSRAALAMMDAMAIDRAFWIGFSKGGGTGIKIAATSPDRISGLVLHDVGPHLPEDFRSGLAHRLASPPSFAGIEEFREHVARQFSRNGLITSSARIDELSAAWARRSATGEIAYHYDPAISQQFLCNPEDFDLWDEWAAISCPTLILRGESSPVLTAAQCAEMMARQPNGQCVTLEGAGHFNFLDAPVHQPHVLEFLAR
jgi:pimeloyl-ACP methyl ester carboxylesterase